MVRKEKTSYIANKSFAVWSPDKFIIAKNASCSSPGIGRSSEYHGFMFSSIKCYSTKQLIFRIDE